MASNGKRIWGVQEKRMLEWSPGTKTWEEVAKFDSGGEELFGIAVVGETPLLIFPSKVLSPTEGRAFDVPQLQERFGKPHLRILTVQPIDHVLWIGTGDGEWGGHLVGLDVRAGRWIQFYDALHYVTGIARGPKDEPIVSWSMSHFNANTLIRVHKPDATPETSYPGLEDHYYQKVTFSPFDKKLYGLDGDTIVTIAEGRPTTVAKLGVAVFREGVEGDRGRAWHTRLLPRRSRDPDCRPEPVASPDAPWRESDPLESSLKPAGGWLSKLVVLAVGSIDTTIRKS